VFSFFFGSDSHLVRYISEERAQNFLKRHFSITSPGVTSISVQKLENWRNNISSHHLRHICVNLTNGRSGFTRDSLNESTAGIFFHYEIMFHKQLKRVNSIEIKIVVAVENVALFGAL
jgi:hypothetical protein